MSDPSNALEIEQYAPLHVVAVDSPVGTLWVESDGTCITRLSFDALPARPAPVPGLLDEARHQLAAYFAQHLKKFDLPVQRTGPPFQNLVWGMLEGIPVGSSTTYQSLADRIGNKAIARMVGNACAHNPTPIIVPCHRVLSSNGSLTGYIGGLWRKRWLLQHEGVFARDLFEKA